MSVIPQTESVVARAGQWSGTVAIVSNQTGDRVRVHVFKGEGQNIRLTDSMDCGAEAGQVAGAIRRARVDRVVGIVPPGQSVCRVVPMPEGTRGDEMLSSLELLAEAQLPARVPDHRRSAGAFPSSSITRTGLLTGWIPGRLSAVERVGQPTWRWVSEPACVAALCGVNSNGVAIAVDSSAGTFTGAVSTGAGSTVRSRIDKPNDASRVAALLHELMRSVGTGVGTALGTGDADTDSIARRATSGSACVVSPQTKAAIGRVFSGSQTDDAWIANHGLACGAAMIALDARPEILSLCTIRSEPVVEKLGIIDRVGATLADPKRAWGVAAMCALLALAAPLGLAYARTLVLEQQLEETSIPEDTFVSLSDEAAVYDHLRTQRWPMTRLMSVVSRAAPVGITVKAVRLSPDVGLRLSGSADNASLVHEFVQNLNTSGVFERARSTSIDATDGQGIEFDLSAQVGTDPHRELPKEFPDFAEETLAVRLYGEGALNTRWIGGDSSSSPSTGRASNRTTSRPARETIANAESETTREPSDRASERPERGGEAGIAPAPSGLSDADIKAMDILAARAAFSARQGYIGANRATMDEETKDRLENEVALLRDHIKSFRGGE